MNKKYILFASLLTILIFFFSLIMIFSNNQNYVVMSSIFVPIFFGILINYDNKQKEIYKIYHEKIFHYVTTYYDILTQPKERLPIKEKHRMISDLSRDLIIYLNNNLAYASEELDSELAIIYFYEYENKYIPNEYQDVYNINSLMPIIINEALENYNILHIDKYCKKQSYLTKKYHKVNGFIFYYVDSYLLDIARKKHYVLSIYETVQFLMLLQKYRDKHYKDYWKIYKYLKRNKEKEIDLIIKELDLKFGIKIKKLKIK